MKAMLAHLRRHRRDSQVVIIHGIAGQRAAWKLTCNCALGISNAGGILESPSIEFGDDSDSKLVENLLVRCVSQHQRQKNGEQP